MNSILQCLNCLPELVAALLGPCVAACMPQEDARCTAQHAGSVRWRPKASVGPALCELLAEMWSQQAAGDAAASAAAAAARRRGCAVSPRRFLEAVSAADERWGDGCQQDSQEFLHSLLEQLQSECNRVQGKPQYRELSSHGSVLQQAAEAAGYARSWHDSLVDDLFGGQLQSTITCSACGAQSHCFDPFLDLSVPLPRGKAQMSLQDCLSAFVEQEVLTGSEAVKCGSCKRTCDATKRLQIFQCPRLLVLTLKRFNSGSSSRGGGAGGWAAGSGGWFGFSPYSKNQTPVKLDAQHALDLSPYCNQQALQAAVDGAGTGRGCSAPKYQLLAVSEHSGCLGGGHYTAQGRSVADGRWYDFNDASVTPDSHPSGSSSSAYVLFFRLVA
ncbi:hypothetical protein OEZ85_011855 [Tetradesmus obliquus]|uniref:ubiquitinyl hydrolase 1 n=1 Tax=Tetradesmus obliquus TaxID=3088 RepID=A0ABY8TVJ5_TETOB|nr:hypothetical protein OEZ85_011855 [Tetradesmus obliquus]